MDVYLLGAGFSSDAGVPTMKNFMEGVRRLQAEDYPPPVRELFRRSLDFAVRLKEENIEELLAKAHNDPVFFDLIWTFGLTVEYYSGNFLRNCRSGDPIGWYNDFAKLVCRTKARVLTLNYDMVLEEALRRQGCDVDYSIRFNETRAAAQIKKPAGSPIRVYKLHGSASWLWCLRCGYTVNGNRHVLKAALEGNPCPRCHCRLVPLLIPPTFHKATALGHVLESLWAEAGWLLGQAERLIVGGISFAKRDADLKKLFKSAAAHSSNLREVVIVNHDPKACLAISELLAPKVPCRTVFSFGLYCEIPK